MVNNINNTINEYYLCYEKFLDYSRDTDAEHEFSTKIIPANSNLIIILERLNINEIDIPKTYFTYEEEEIEECLKDYSQNVKELTIIIWNKISYRTNEFVNIDTMCGSSFFKLLSKKYVFNTYYSWYNIDSIFALPNKIKNLDDRTIQEFIAILR